MNGLSICIPVYNFNCIKSIKIICKQAEDLAINAEVLVIDDASTINIGELSSFQNQFYTFEKLTQNIGRSKIRNLLVEKSRFNHILFLDGDSGIPENFIKDYLLAIKKNPESIICGGRVHTILPSKKKCLRHKYGVRFEDKKAVLRSKTPYHRFMTNNFVSTKHILKIIPFNEELIKYGHEDTFFGYELSKRKVKIIHIDNPVVHLDIDSNIDYIKKTKQSIENLVLLKTKYPKFITTYSKLLSLINKFSFFKLNLVKKISITISKPFEITARYLNSTYSFQLFKFFYTISINK